MNNAKYVDPDQSQDNRVQAENNESDEENKKTPAQ